MALALGLGAPAAAAPPAARFEREIRPFLEEHCYDCHADGREKGQVAFDTFASVDALLAERELWAKVLTNVRADLMPPSGHPRPTGAQRRRLEAFVKRDVLGISARDPDPGRVTLRRLNRVEYRNTIRDLTGFDLKVEDELPPDDTGFGFDNNGDVLTLSPLLLEKYMQLAETIVAASVPRTARVPAAKALPAEAFRAPDGSSKPKLSFREPADLAQKVAVDPRKGGRYRLEIDAQVGGPFDFDPGRAKLTVALDGEKGVEQELGWTNHKSVRFSFERALEPGDHRVGIVLAPLPSPQVTKTPIELKILAVTLHGPLDEARWVRPPTFDRFFTKDPPQGASEEERRAYAAEALGRFATRAFRRPVDAATIEKLVNVAAAVWGQPGKRLEDGIAEALVPVLSSPRFLYRVEGEAAAAPGGRAARHPFVDEYALASRLSYFLWSTMPDDELFRLAAAGKLRRGLHGQVERMLRDPRAQALVENFTGQWLQTRDVQGIDIAAAMVLARDKGEEKEMLQIQAEIEALQAQPPQKAPEKPTPEQEAERKRRRERFGRFFRPAADLTPELRTSMQQETEQTFAHVVRKNRPVVELLDADYTFLNEKLAKHYDVPGVTGPEMRLVKLPRGSVRGGILTQGSTLVVTSNPTRTSPVKRGLFILDNVLGVPPPPAPADVPPLEEAEKKAGDREPTLREALAVHREKPLCNSCHNRMDPLGLALENFNAMGMWREQERGQKIDAAGKLVTGESFSDIREVKRVLATKHRRDFYRCLTEKLLTYALGRGLSHADVGAVDEIVARLERNGGRFQTLLTAVVDSAPFQRRRARTPIAGMPGPLAPASSAPRSVR